MKFRNKPEKQVLQVKLILDLHLAYMAKFKCTWVNSQNYMYKPPTASNVVMCYEKRFERREWFFTISNRRRKKSSTQTCQNCELSEQHTIISKYLQRVKIILQLLHKLIKLPLYKVIKFLHQHYNRYGTQLPSMSLDRDRPLPSEGRTLLKWQIRNIKCEMALKWRKGAFKA